MAQNKTTAVAKAPTGALARPSFIKAGDTRGTENISPEDLRIPRLALAQALSPELKKGDPKYIEELEFGQAFNSITGQVYGKGPVEVVVVRADKARWIEFDPKNRGVILDRDVPAGDKRTEWGSGEDGKPAATKFLEFVALLLPTLEPIALSFKGSGIKAGQLVSTLIKLKAAQLGGAPSFAFKLSLTTGLEKNAKGEYAVFVPRLTDTVGEETYAAASAFYDSIKDQALAPDETAAGEPESHPADSDKDDVPF